MSEISTQDSEGKKELFIEEESQDHETKNCMSKASIKAIVAALEAFSPSFKSSFSYFVSRFIWISLTLNRKK